MHRLSLIPALLIVAACASPAAQTDRPMDEVPVQTTLEDGSREYRFLNGCVVVLEPAQAVLVSESEACELYHRDIALLYAAAD